MWRIIDLKKGDFINLNGELFEIVNKTSSLPSPTSNELELTLELVKMGDKQSAPNFRLIYTEKAGTIKLEALDKREGIWKEQKITKLGF